MSIDDVLTYHNITISQLAEGIDYDLGGLSKIYRGVRPMTLTVAYKLSRYMYVDIDMFYRTEENEFEDNSDWDSEEPPF